MKQGVSKSFLFRFALLLVVGTANAANTSITPTQSGARLCCSFQRLNSEATADGLWLTSTATSAATDRFRVKATEVGRKYSESSVELAATGDVSVEGQTVRFSRQGLMEEYSVSMDGVRQDFIVEQSPAGTATGELSVKLAVAGAEVEPVSDGARLVLENSRRLIAYSRLRATDATGKELPARIELSEGGDFFTNLSFLTPDASEVSLEVVVEDRDAVYPVRIDPTFSDANWISLGSIPGVGSDVVNWVQAEVVDGSGNAYVAGLFNAAGDILANNIAEWNGTNWSALGLGVNGPVYALAIAGNTLYAGGDFTMAGGNAATCIAEWNGTNWSGLGTAVSNYDAYLPGVNALAVSGNTLYAAGYFTNVGGVGANCIAGWNGTNWFALGSGLNYTANALAVSGNTLYAGGDFTIAGGNTANYVAEWNGSSWSALGVGVNSSVNALAVSGNTLYAGGNFFKAGGNAANYIAQWNGSSWSPLGTGVTGPGAEGFTDITALAVMGGTLYAGGGFTEAGGVPARDIALWNGSTWSAPGPGLSTSELDELYALAASSNTLYMGGSFTEASGVPALNFAQWNGINWSAAGVGINNYVDALAVSGTNLYAGGRFVSAGNSIVNYVAQWNGSSWSGMEGGISGTSGGSGPVPFVTSLATSGSSLYMGGYFTTAGSASANNIAEWNGNSWSALGSGTDGTVYALAVSGNTLYAGGQFTNAGGIAANNLAEWNGSSWSALGTGLNGPVFALAISGGTLYVGGQFSVAGASTANDVAAWNGSSWSALASGMGTVDGQTSYVYALAVSGSTLYAGGYFTNAGGVMANYIAQWNGSSWAPLGVGTGVEVFALAVSGGTLYMGGSFTMAGGNPANYIAQWDGANWSAMGSGMNSEVRALVASNGALYAGGYFTTVGTNVSGGVAEANLTAPNPIITTNMAAGFTNGVFGFEMSGPPGSNVVIEASTDLQTWIPLQTNVFGSGLLYFMDTQSPGYQERFYRTVLH